MYSRPYSTSLLLLLVGEIVDLDSVEIGQIKSLELRLTNTCSKNLVLNVSELYLLNERDINISPKSVLLKVQQTCLLTLTFSPKSMLPQLDVNLRFKKMKIIFVCTIEY